MRKKGYFLGTCSTCSAIMKDIDFDGFELKEIKSEGITEDEVNEMKSLAGTYESLFSRRAMKYRGWGLHEKQLSEDDYRDLIVKEYTFLKRPVFILGDRIFVGNTKPVIEAFKKALNS